MQMKQQMDTQAQPHGVAQDSAEAEVIGRITFASGERMDFTEPQAYLQTIREELPYFSTTGFRCHTLGQDPELKKAVDDILLDFAGERNPRRACNYGLTEKGLEALRQAADPHVEHTYSDSLWGEGQSKQEISPIFRSAHSGGGVADPKTHWSYRE